MSWRNLVREELRDLAPYHVPRREGVILLDANESPYALPDDVAAELGRLLAQVPVHRYPDAQAVRLRALIAEDTGVAADQITLGNGSDELIALLVQAFGKPRRGDARARVAYPVPTFTMFRVCAIAGGALPLEMALRDDFMLDAVALERQITGGRPNLVFFARPNNPTGTLWDRAVIEALAERHPDLLVVVDEAYGGYAGETMLDVVARRANVVVLRSTSKIGLAGIRLGFLVGQPEVVREVEKVRLPYNVNAFTQRAAELLLAAPTLARLRERTDAVVAERDRLFAELGKRPGVQAFPSRANFVLLRVAGASAIHRAIAERGVLVRDLSSPGALRDCLRVTVGTPDENEAFLRALDEALAHAGPAAEPPAPAEEREEEEGGGDEDAGG